LGEFELAEKSVHVNEGEAITLLPTENGLVAVIGYLSDEDEPVLERLLADL